MWVLLILSKLWFSQFSVDNALRTRICREPPLVHRCTSGPQSAMMLHFYNTRDVPAARWGVPEVLANVNHDELGNLGLTAAEEAAIVAFLKTLTDQ